MSDMRIENGTFRHAHTLVGKRMMLNSCLHTFLYVCPYTLTNPSSQHKDKVSVLCKIPKMANNIVDMCYLLFTVEIELTLLLLGQSG